MKKLFGLFEVENDDAFLKGKKIDITNGLEKYLWDMSSDDLAKFISYTKSNEAMKPFYDVAKRVQDQREFMKRNRELRKALVPNIRK